MGKQRDRARAHAAKLTSGVAEVVTPAVAPLRCPTCDAPVPLGSADVATCVACGAQVPLPESHRTLRDAERAGSADRVQAEALYRKLGSPSRTLDTWVAITTLAGGAVAAIAAGLLAVSVVFAFLAGFALEFFLHWIAPLVGIDFIDRYGGGTTYAGFAVAVIVFGLFPVWFKGYLHTAGDIRTLLQTQLAARAPQRPGFPSTCRLCGAALDVPAGALGVRCAYCQADNLVALPQAIVRRTADGQAQFHRSIVEAAARASALRREARAGLPRYAGSCAIAVVVFGLLGRGCTSLDLDHSDMPMWSDSMTSPRAIVPVWDRQGGTPIDTDWDNGMHDYVLALHRHETLELVSRDDGWCASVSIRNTTTFPLFTRSWEPEWSAHPDGSYGAAFRAPYTGLYLLKIDGIDHGSRRGHIRWQLGEPAAVGLPPAPAIEVTAAAVPPAKSVPAYLATHRHDLMVAPAEQAVAITAANGKLSLWATGGDKPLDRSVGGDDILAIDLARDGRHALAATADQIGVYAIAGTKLVWLGDVCSAQPVVAVAFVSPALFVAADAKGELRVYNAADGHVRYALPNTAPVERLDGGDGELFAIDNGHARRFTTAQWHTP